MPRKNSASSSQASTAKRLGVLITMLPSSTSPSVHAVSQALEWSALNGVAVALPVSWSERHGEKECV